MGTRGSEFWCYTECNKDICCTRQVFVFILGYYKLRISAVPAGHYLLLALIFE